MRRGSNYYPPNESRRVSLPGGFISLRGAQKPSISGKPCCAVVLVRHA